jgi:hypothetical protein
MVIHTGVARSVRSKADWCRMIVTASVYMKDVANQQCFAYPSERAWFEEVCALVSDHKKQQWRIGDLLLYGQQNFDVNEPTGGCFHFTLPLVAKATGYDESSLQDFRRVARAFPEPTRVGDLSWHHHQAVASSRFTAEQRDDLLNDALAYKYSAKQLAAFAKTVVPTGLLAPDHLPGHPFQISLPWPVFRKLESLAKAAGTTPEKQAMQVLLDALGEIA